MKKIKILFSANDAELEEKVNKFIANKQIIDIKFASDFAISSDGDKDSYFNAMIIYEE